MNTLNFKQQFTQNVNAKHNIIKLLDKTQEEIFLTLVEGNQRERVCDRERNVMQEERTAKEYAYVIIDIL